MTSPRGGSPLATAFVKLRPDGRDFEKDAKRDVAKAGPALAKEGARQGKLFGGSFSKDATREIGKAGPAIGREGEKAGKRFSRDAENSIRGAGGTGIADAAGDAGKKAGKQFGSGFSDNAGKLLGGAALGATLVKGVTESLARGDVRAKLGAQLNLSPAETKRLGKLSGELYAANYGESLAEVSSAVRKVVQDTNTSIRSVNLKPVTAQVLSLAGAFEQDFGQVTRAVGQLVRTGLAKDTQAALDIITRGFQKGADKSEDFLDTLNEYGTQFRKMGLSGARATGILTQGLQAGARDADIVADAIKEFSIRAVDGSETTKHGFKALGLSAETMATKFGKGGRTAREALDTVLDRLRNVEDPVRRSRVAVELFGTQAEDLGEALFAIDPSKAVESLGKVEGAAKKVDTALGETANAGFKSFLRGLEEDVVGGLDVATEAFSGFVGILTGNEAAIKNAGDNIRNSLNDLIGEENTKELLGFSGDFQSEINEMARLATGSGATMFDTLTGGLQDAAAKVRNFPKEVELTGEISDLDRKIKKAEREIKDVPPEKRTEFQGKIDDLREKRRLAQQEINRLQGKTVKVGLAGLKDINATFNALKGLGSSEAGGLIPGPKSERDNHLRMMATGEYVIRSRRVTHKTLPILEMINQGRMPDGYAGGGIVAEYRGAKAMPQIESYARQLRLAMPNLVDLISSTASDLIKSAFGSGAGGAALSFARSQAGKPYIWGGVGPAGYDCSGFMSAILNVIQGRSPHSRRGTTSTFPWSGFTPGVGRFMIGHFKGGSGIGGSIGGGIGHMAGTLNGVNVESRGGDGVVVGGSARGATSSMFTGPYKLKGFAKGGLVGPKGDPPFDLLAAQGLYSRDLLKQLTGYRRGTPWVPEDQLAWVHKGEGIVPREVNEARLRGGGTTRLHRDDLRALADMIERAVGNVRIDLDGRRVSREQGRLVSGFSVGGG